MKARQPTVFASCAIVTDAAAVVRDHERVRWRSGTCSAGPRSAGADTERTPRGRRTPTGGPLDVLTPSPPSPYGAQHVERGTVDPPARPGDSPHRSKGPPPCGSPSPGSRQPGSPTPGVTASARAGSTSRCGATTRIRSTSFSGRSVSGTSGGTACSATGWASTAPTTTPASGACATSSRTSTRSWTPTWRWAPRLSSDSASCRPGSPPATTPCSGGRTTSLPLATRRSGRTSSAPSSGTWSTATASTRCASGRSRCGTSPTWRPSGPRTRTPTTASTR